MQINPLKSNGIFKTGASQSAGGVTGEMKSKASEKTDTIEISRYGSDQCVFKKLAREISQDIQAMDDSAREDAIRSAVEEGRYDVSADKVAQAILARIFSE
jgi:anti-sigma28 factor (negative regulator of flagellin synthesis)